jgi:hypothetical protein
MDLGMGKMDVFCFFFAPDDTRAFNPFLLMFQCRMKLLLDQLA